jgi:uncharacterized membrane protein YhaH (DUF805 family)
MGFGAAVSSVFSKYATFSGRARRSEYWWWILFTVIIAVIAAVADNGLGLKIAKDSSLTYGWISVVAWLVLLLPTIAVTFRRLHDTGRSGWWWLLSLICGIGAIIVLIFCVSDSKPGANEYGPNPKGA